MNKEDEQLFARSMKHFMEFDNEIYPTPFCVTSFDTDTINPCKNCKAPADFCRDNGQAGIMKRILCKFPNAIYIRDLPNRYILKAYNKIKEEYKRLEDK